MSMAAIMVLLIAVCVACGFAAGAWYGFSTAQLRYLKAQEELAKVWRGVPTTPPRGRSGGGLW